LNFSRSLRAIVGLTSGYNIFQMFFKIFYFLTFFEFVYVRNARANSGLLFMCTSLIIP